MACCKCCCGNADCTEGQQGKCCCGGASGTCCQANEHCCSGVCQEGPCDSVCEGWWDCADGECCASGDCVPGYYILDVGDCVCSGGDINDGGYTYIDEPALIEDTELGDYAFTTRQLCCDFRDASDFPPCSDPPP